MPCSGRLHDAAHACCISLGVAGHAPRLGPAAEQPVVRAVAGAGAHLESLTAPLLAAAAAPGAEDAWLLLDANGALQRMPAGAALSAAPAKRSQAQSAVRVDTAAPADPAALAAGATVGARSTDSVFQVLNAACQGELAPHAMAQQLARCAARAAAGHGQFCAKPALVGPPLAAAMKMASPDACWAGNAKGVAALPQPKQPHCPLRVPHYGRARFLWCPPQPPSPTPPPQTHAARTRAHVAWARCGAPAPPTP